MKKAVVVKEHISKYPDIISFYKGTKVTVGQRDEQYLGWIKITLDNISVWAPEEYLDVSEEGNAAITNNAYCSRELDTKVSERVIISKEICGWVWARNKYGESGWIPKETIKMIDNI